ncbi:type I secretion system permease/ATPase [Sphingomonas sp. HT-1]|uniref:type I secretion system permease/ATPase n=1 Tax=unclassified Sphingomonas TaxID=196159 RepID=UPI000376AF73|nr:MULTISPECIES: type I secretion system permease/ATPase [unclassified Sphingomonas]
MAKQLAEEPQRAVAPMRAALAACRRHWIAAAGFSALVNLLYIAPTLYMLQVYDRVVPTQGVQTLAFLTLVLLFALACLSLLDRVRSRLLTRAGVVLNAALAPMVLDATIGRPELPAARSAVRDLDTMRATLTGPAMLALFDAPWTPIYVGVCFLVHPLIGALALAGGLILTLIAWRNEKATRAGLDRAQDVASQTYAAQDVMLSAADSVRALGMRRAMVARQQRKREAMLALQTESGLHAGGYFTATKFVRLALQSLALGLGAWLAVDNLISGGAIFAASFLIARALAPIELVIGSWKTLAQARTGYQELDRLLASAVARPEPTRLPAPQGALTLEGLTIFNAARDAAVLNGISFAVAPGEVVAIVGPSGAGKSTLLRAIVGALPVDRGAVRIDAAEIGDWDPERLARHIGYLPQDSVLFEGTVKENIARFEGELGAAPEAVDAAVVAAADLVAARALILRLPGGFDHRLGLNGRGVSAGQAQRIALARAVYGDPALYVLDEPNAHLDSEGDVALNAAITQLKAAGKTILVVSHKLGVLPVVDKMLVLRDGRVELFGPRDEVLAKIAPPNVRRMVPAAQGGSAA